MIKAIVDAVTIPVMAKVRIGHFVEAQVSIFSLFLPLHSHCRHFCNLQSVFILDLILECCE